MVAIRLGKWLEGRRLVPFDSVGEPTTWFTWMHRLGRTEFREAAESLRDSALRAAAHNPRVASLFASVFAAFGRFTVEAEIVRVARAALPDGRLYAPQADAMEALRRAAEENDRRTRKG